MPDYAALLDAETWAFVRRTAEWYPPDAAGLSIAEQRRIYDAMCRAFFRGHPPGVAAADRAFGGVPCRLYTVAGPMPATVLYLHGGGFVVGGLDSHDDICAEIAARCGLRVVSADYRLAPEHPHPAAFEDALAAAGAVAAAFPGPLVLAGDSAGGNLAAAVAHAGRRTGPVPAGQVLIYPGLGGDRTRGSHVTHAAAPMLTAADIAFYARMRHPAGEPAGDPTAAPLADTDFSGLPPTVIVTAECDPLADDGPIYAARLRAAGGRAVCIEGRGLVHGWLRARTSVGRAAAGFDRIVTAIAALGRGDWPYGEPP
jgi:acetyl esterase